MTLLTKKKKKTKKQNSVVSVLETYCRSSWAAYSEHVCVVRSVGQHPILQESIVRQGYYIIRCLLLAETRKQKMAGYKKPKRSN